MTDSTRPIPSAKAPTSAGDTGDDARDAPPPLSVLALDDDPDFRQFIASLLEGEGHDVRAVGDREAFFGAIESRTPDLVLLDMHMGRLTGGEVLSELRQRWPRLCVVVLTGHPSLASMRETFKQDVFDYLVKPFSTDELRRVLAQAARAFHLGERPQDRLRAELGRQVKVARTHRGWTLKDLSDAAGVSVSQISSIERGTHLPSLESLLALASALDAKPSEWVGSAGF